MTAVLVEILLGVARCDMDRGAESDMVGGRVPGKVDGIGTVEQFKESIEGVGPMGPE